MPASWELEPHTRSPRSVPQTPLTCSYEPFSFLVKSTMAQRKVAARSIVRPSVARLALIGATSQWG